MGHTASDHTVFNDLMGSPIARMLGPIDCLDYLREIALKCLSGEPLDEDLSQWLGNALEQFLNRHCQTIEDAFGLKFPRVVSRGGARRRTANATAPCGNWPSAFSANGPRAQRPVKSRPLPTATPPPPGATTATTTKCPNATREPPTVSCGRPSSRAPSCPSGSGNYATSSPSSVRPMAPLEPQTIPTGVAPPATWAIAARRAVALGRGRWRTPTGQPWPKS